MSDRSAEIPGKLALTAGTVKTHVQEARAFFDHLLARLQALDAEHDSSPQQRQHVQGDIPSGPVESGCSPRHVESDAVKLYLASVNALLKASEALVDARSGLPAPNRAAMLADLVNQTKEACRIAYRAALLITDSLARRDDEASDLPGPAGTNDVH